MKKKMVLRAPAIAILVFSAAFIGCSIGESDDDAVPFPGYTVEGAPPVITNDDGSVMLLPPGNSWKEISLTLNGFADLNDKKSTVKISLTKSEAGVIASKDVTFAAGSAAVKLEIPWYGKYWVKVSVVDKSKEYASNGSINLDGSKTLGYSDFMTAN